MSLHKGEGTDFTSSSLALEQGELESLAAERDMPEQVKALKALQKRIQSLGYEVEQFPSGWASKSVHWCRNEFDEVKKELERLKVFFSYIVQLDLFLPPHELKHKKMSMGEIKAAYNKLIEDLEESLEAIERGLAGMPEKKE